MDSEYRTETNKINKSIGGIYSLKNVTFKVKPGEIHALVGQIFGASVVGMVIGGLKCL